MKKSVLLAAAVTGMMLGGATVARAETGTSNGSQLRPSVAQRMADPPAADKHACKGKNGCKGKGGCKTDKHACKGKNDCKGQGGCATDGSKDAPKK